MDLRFLKDIANFAKANYELWSDMHEDDIALWFLQSYKDMTLIPVLIGVGDKMEMIALYEYWTVTPGYIQRLKDATGNSMPLPDPLERKGNLIFFPVTIVSKEYRGKGFSLSKILQEKFMRDFPKAEGVYRWVLKDQRVRFMPFRRKSDGN